MTKAEADWIVRAETRDRVGEGPLWNAEENALYWVDILDPAINRLSLQTGALRRWTMPEPIGFIVFRRNHPGFVAGMQSGFYAIQLDPFCRQPLGDPERLFGDNRLNDGKVDASGRLWAGTMSMSGEESRGTLYRFDHDHSWHAMDSGYTVTNGPAFSPAQDYFYHSDSARRIIFRFDLDKYGKIRDKKPFVCFPEQWGYPDGMTVDADGGLWVAHWDGGRVSRFDPDGKLDFAVPLPATRITSCVFGGPELDRLFITSARDGRDDEPLAGALFEVSPGFSGLPAGRFAG
jgi:D-xylonolactonase